MPTGKLGNWYGLQALRPLPYTINVRSLRRKVKIPPPLTVNELRKYRHALRKALTIYMIEAGTLHLTATERRAILSDLQKAALKFARRPSKQFADELLDLLDGLDVNTAALIERLVVKCGHPKTAVVVLKRQLRGLFSLAVYPDEEFCVKACESFLDPLAHITDRESRNRPQGAGIVSRAVIDRAASFYVKNFPVVRILATLEIDQPSNACGRRRKPKGRWPDPPLANLVLALEPIWCRVTGQAMSLNTTSTPGRKDVRNSKSCPFAKWAATLIGDAVGTAGQKQTLVHDPCQRELDRPFLRTHAGLLTGGIAPEAGAQAAATAQEIANIVRSLRKTNTKIKNRPR
jgi:hypothetical protein